MSQRTPAPSSSASSDATATAILRMRSVSRHYGDPPNRVEALHQVDFDAYPGELVALMGPSGSGKSTLLTIAGGLESPSSGTVEIDGANLVDLDADRLAETRRRRVGFVFQEFNLLTGLTVAENVAAPLELDGVSASEAKAAALQRLEEVHLADRANAFPTDLSGGERQRVAIARSLIGKRRLLLADEPTGALDSETGAEIMSLLRQACTLSTSVVVVTHNQSVAEGADRIVRIRDGGIVNGTTAPASGLSTEAVTR